MDDPYRSSQASGTCVRCRNSMQSDGELGRMVCLAGCGEWYPRSAFERAWSQITSHTSVVEPPPWPWLPAPCAVCRQAMLVGYKQELRYDFCATHGVWLDAGEVDRFTELFESR